MHKLNRIEKKLVLFFNKNNSTLLDTFSSAISNIPSLVISWIVIGIYILFSDLLYGIIVDACLALVFMIHFSISDGLIKYGAKKLSLERKRPYMAYPGEVRSLGRKLSDSSFPSSHVAALTGGFVVLVYFYKNLLPWAILTVLIMSWSRLRNGMHYPSDIVAGLILGLAYGSAAIFLLNILLSP